MRCGALASITALTFGGLLLWLVISGSVKTTVYTEKDFFSYHTLTHKEIENATRITDNYYFEAHPGDGYSPSNSIIFKGAADTTALHAYLEKLGYVKQKRTLGEKEIWAKPNQLDGELFYLYVNPATREIELTKVLTH